uniref:G_PROTEIN_RECEP_F1_2 domain-containing protein n=1 Tax=Heterorhabditis bacteriophora TaxID=37862 RepID=A0A1I7XG32_HETBA
MSTEYDYAGDRLEGNETYEYDEDSMLSGDPMVRFVAMAVIVIYIMAFTIGIPANLYVLFRMRRLASNDEERYRNGTGVALCSMAAADLCSLLLIFAQNLHQMTANTDGDTAFTDAMCKMMLFLTHTMTGISIWSWLLLSSLRYLAICHPLYHLRLWQMPYRALAFLMSVVLNAWLLVAVQSTQMGYDEIQVTAIFPLITYRISRSSDEFSEDAAQLATRMLAQALYFSQFAFNAIYLAVFVYDKSTRTKGELSSHHSCHAGQFLLMKTKCKSSTESITALQPMRSRLHSTSGADSPLMNVQKSSFVRLLHPDNSNKAAFAHL